MNFVTEPADVTLRIRITRSEQEKLRRIAALTGLNATMPNGFHYIMRRLPEDERELKRVLSGNNG